MSAPKLTAEDVGQRVLKLIDSIHSADDIAPANLEKAMGMKVEFNEENPNLYGFGDDLTDTWSYNLLTISGSDKNKPTELIFSFNDRTGSASDMTAVCAMGFDDYARALVAAGFKASDHVGEHGLVVSTDFTRGSVTVRVSVDRESEANPERGCVSLMTIST